MYACTDTIFLIYASSQAPRIVNEYKEPMFKKFTKILPLLPKRQSKVTRSILSKKNNPQKLSIHRDKAYLEWCKCEGQPERVIS